MHKAFVCLAALSCFALYGSRLTLKSGSSYEGTFVSGTSSTITFRDDKGVEHRFPLGDVQNIDFSQQYAPLSSASRLGQSIELPAGTKVSVRTSEAIDSNSATEGRTYAATVAQDIADSSGAVVIPRGSEAQLAIRDVNGGGTVGSANLVLALESVMVSRSRYLVNAGTVKESGNEGIGKNRRTGEMVGGGAALGTLLGAIAGGGRGAAIGAIAGAVTGGTVQVLTRGKQVKVPAETVLNFQLDQPLQLRRAGTGS